MLRRLGRSLMPSGGRYGTQVRTSLCVMSSSLGWLVNRGYRGEQTMSDLVDGGEFPPHGFSVLVCKD